MLTFLVRAALVLILLGLLIITTMVIRDSWDDYKKYREERQEERQWKNFVQTIEEARNEFQ